MGTQLRTKAPVVGLLAMIAVGLMLATSVSADAKKSNQRISVKLKSNKAGAKTGGNITLRPPAPKGIKGNGLIEYSFFLPKGAIVSAQSLGRCKKSVLEKTRKCPKKSLISTGSTNIRTTYEGMDDLTASIRLYSGEDVGDLLMEISEPMTDVTMVIEGSIRGAAAKGYGYEFRFTDMPVEPLGPGSDVYIYPAQMRMKIADNGLYRNPRKCNKGGWKFGFRFKSEKSGTSPIYSKRVRCRG